MLSILVGAIVLFAFGALWYTVLFGKMWSGLMNFPPMEGERPSMTKPLIANFLVNLITASVVYYLFPQLLAISFYDFAKVMVIIWLGFSLPIYVNQALWEGKSWKLIILNSANGIIASVLIAAVIYFMQR
jgi:hypothetical protein